jgi:hypothetical protein
LLNNKKFQLFYTSIEFLQPKPFQCKKIKFSAKKLDAIEDKTLITKEILLVNIKPNMARG